MQTQTPSCSTTPHYTQIAVRPRLIEIAAPANDDVLRIYPDDTKNTQLATMKPWKPSDFSGDCSTNSSTQVKDYLEIRIYKQVMAFCVFSNEKHGNEKHCCRQFRVFTYSLHIAQRVAQDSCSS